MKSDTIRSTYLSYFEQRDHRVVQSSPVVPQGDPTLLFTNAGMNQFKDLLLGNDVRDYTRATSVQKCIRAGGKHNDLDEVGRDGRHLTFFEMLGNWSFGDYYKKESIEWAWDFCLNVLELDETRLYVTVHHDDDESRDLWLDTVGVNPAHLLALGDDENFWAMGPTGPCGPCTEIHYDLLADGPDFEFVEGYDDDRIVEIWNLVFMEFNRSESGELDPLPMKSVDTGMGLDRVAMVKEGVANVFHTDLFRPILKRTAGLLDIEITDWNEFYNRDDFTEFAVIADHVRAVMFSLCDGAKFSNEGAGYVVRRILRRAVRHGRNLGFEAPFLFDVAHAVIENFGHAYPELQAVGNSATELIKLEEERFFRNIDRGIELFETAAQELQEAGKDTIPAEKIFDLYTTYGFPPDLTRIMAEEKGLKVDLEGYETLLESFRDTSRGKDMYEGAAGVGDWNAVHDGEADNFVGYSNLESTAQVLKYRAVEDDVYELLLDSTPFYAESGGQIGDTGTLESPSVAFEVNDTQRAPMGIVHTAKLTKGKVTQESLRGVTFEAQVDHDKRRLTEANHTATHLLHAALRNLVSDQIFQSGSLVSDRKLRFDFSHSKPLTSEEVSTVEARVNEQIRAAHPVVAHVDIDRDRAVEQMGAMAIFGEKYGDRVRVIEVPGESVELCGGTHVDSTSDINVFRIVSETGVAAGIRRIEAVTNVTALETFQNDRRTLESLAQTLKTDLGSVEDRVGNLLEERQELERRVQKLSQQLANAGSDELVEDAVEIDGVRVIAKALNVETRDQMLKFADSLRGQLDEAVVLLGAPIDGKAALLCMVTDTAFKSRGLKAGDLINSAASHVDGRGGGRPTLAQAGGSNVDGIGAAVAAFESIVRESLEK